MLSRLSLCGFSGDLQTAVASSVADDPSVRLAVQKIINDVRERGDEALLDYTERFDGCRPDDLRVSTDDLQVALDEQSSETRTALKYARDEITAYHQEQLFLPKTSIRSGVQIQEKVVPVARAGLYVPGGRAQYPSTVLMTAIPALVAGVDEIVLCVPPDRNGLVPSATLAAAALLGLTEVYRVGGAQAIAAFAFGTKSIRAVDVIVGPGNQYVAAAKREVAGLVGMESIAGPSEVVIVADASVPANFIAADLIAQAEHGPGGTAVLITWDSAVADAVDQEIERRLVDAPRREDILATLATGGRSIMVDNPEQAMKVVNAIAPEHLEILTVNPDDLVPLVRNAGAVFCGPWSPAAVGDYVVGVNHVLPTARSARFASALRVNDFQKYIHVVSLDEKALRRVAPYISALTAVEGLEEHGRSVNIRLESP
jgi:histidinol dehydrogenase